MAPIVSVVIINWNTKELLRACLRSLSATAVPLQIIVLDNASVDESAAMVEREFPQVQLIANARNLGYAAANNQGARLAKGRYLLLLNPDTQVLPNTIERLLAFADAHPEAGAVAPKLVYPDGQLQPSVRSFPTPAALFFSATGLDKLFPHSRIFGRYRMSWFTYDQVAEVDQPMASALLVRRAAWEQVGGMDERMSIFFNDVDLCWRIKRAGWQIYFFPEATVIHHHGASTRLLGLGRLWASHQGLLAFYDKHFRPLLPMPLYIVLRSAIAFGSLLRIALVTVANFLAQRTR